MSSGLWSHVTNSWRFACIYDRRLQRWLLQLLLLKLTVVSLLIGSVTSLLWCCSSVSLAVVNLWHFRSSSHLWRCLPQMQAEHQEFVTWDHGSPVRKTPYTILFSFKLYYEGIVHNFGKEDTIVLWQHFVSIVECTLLCQVLVLKLLGLKAMVYGMNCQTLCFQLWKTSVAWLSEETCSSDIV